MMADACLDTSAWLEYFNAGPHGPKVRAILEGEERVFTPASVVAELIEAARRRKQNTQLFLRFLQAKSDVVPMNAEVARLAGRINAEHTDDPNWTMMESFVVATATYTGSRLLTRDPIYEGLPRVQLLRRATRAAARGASEEGTTGPA
jgi:predicted nucleic acid-binding protein